MKWSKFNTTHATWISQDFAWEPQVARHCEIVEKNNDYMLLITDDMRIRIEPGFNDNQVYPGWIVPATGMVFDINGKLL